MHFPALSERPAGKHLIALSCQSGKNRMLRKPGLHHDFAGRIPPPGAARHLHEGGKKPFLGTDIGTHELRVGV